MKNRNNQKTLSKKKNMKQKFINLYVAGVLR